MERYTDTISGEELYVKAGKAGKGYKYYYKDKAMTIRHRHDGPASQEGTRYKAWYINDIRHRLDGPAVEYSKGSKAWWVNDVLIMWLDKDGKIIERME